MDTYKVDDTLHHVNLEVDVGTTAIAATSVFWETPNGSQHLFDSSQFSGGDIPYRKAGNNRDLKGTSLDIKITLDYSNVPPVNRPDPDKVIDEVSVKFSLKGGPDGEQHYGIGRFDIDATSMPIVRIDKEIQLV